MYFRMTVYHPVEGIARFACVAHDDASARGMAAERGFSVLSLRVTRGGRKGKFRVALFAHELLALLEAGMSLVEAIDILASRARDGMTREILQRVLSLLHEGQPLSAAFASAPEFFPTLFVATVKASEQTGNLAVALQRFLSYHKQLNAVRDKLVAAAIYPALLLAVGVLVIMFLMSYVVPRFGRVYSDLGKTDIPFMSHLLMDWGMVVTQHGSLLLAGALSFVVVICYGATRAESKAFVQRLVWRLPHLGRQVRTYQLARFSRTIAMLIQGGVPLVTALEMTDALLQQPSLRAGLQGARTAIREGATLAESFRIHGLATEVGIRLLVVGERGGNLGATMDKVAAFYDDEITREVEWFSKLFEPALMVFMGCVIGTIVILMYLPIFDLASNIK